MIKLPTLKKFFEAGVHFGHQKYRSFPQARKYVFQVRDGVLIFDLEKTAQALKLALEFLRDAVAEGKVPMVVGTKRHFRDLVTEVAKQLGLPYVTSRWPGGMLTNFETMRAQITKYNDLMSQVGSEAFEKKPKKERLALQRKLQKMGKLFAGLRTIDRLPDLLLVIGATAERTAIAEARRMEIPTVAVTDSDANPELVTYPIPANDDSRRSIELLLSLIKQAIEEGRTKAKRHAKKKDDRKAQKAKS